MSGSRLAFGFALALVALAPACKHDGATPTKDAPATGTNDAWVAPPPSASAASSTSVSSADASATPDPYAELPPIDEDGASVILADRIAGFSSDDKYLGWQISTCDPCPSEFHFRGPGAAPVDLFYHWDPGADGTLPADVAEKRRKAADGAVDARLKSLAADKVEAGRKLRGPFPYPDLIFHVTTGQTSRAGTVALLFGAHVASEPANLSVHPIRIELGPHEMLGKMSPEERARIAKLPPAERAKAQKDWDDSWGMNPPRLAYANVTKDGRDIGVVAIAGGSMWFETGGSARMSAAAFAAEIYEQTGHRRLDANDAAGAAVWLAKAEAAKPDDPRFSYELATALARQKDPKTKDALDRALAHAGGASNASSATAAMKQRIRGDAAFDGVRNEPWFADLR